MTTRRVEFRIFRYKPEHIHPPRYDAFRLQAEDALTVLDALELIRRRHDPTLMHRHSCHHSACGTCACRINGVERLACTTRVLELDADTLTLEPLMGFAHVGDLVVDMTGFFRDIDPNWSTLKPCEPLPGVPQTPDKGSLLHFEECIECGICVSACPAAAKPSEFMGPAALAALHNQLPKSPEARRELLAAAGGPRGERLCERALACSRRCPTRVYPARHIEDLRRALGTKESP